MGYAVIAVLVCVLLDFMNPAQALGGWLGRRGASYRSCAYSSPDHLNIVSKSRGGLSSSKLHHISKMASAHPVKETIYNVKSGSERGIGSAVIAVLVCVFIGFHESCAQALGGWLGWTWRLLRELCLIWA